MQVGEACMLKMALEMPAVVDEMDDAVTKNYAAMPERLFLIGPDGKVAYRWVTEDPKVQVPFDEVRQALAGAAATSPTP